MNKKEIEKKKYYVGGLWLSKEELSKETLENKKVTKKKAEVMPKKLTDLQKYQKLRDIHLEMRDLGIKQRKTSARIRQLAQQISNYL